MCQEGHSPEKPWQNYDGKKKYEKKLNGYKKARRNLESESGRASRFQRG